VRSQSEVDDGLGEGDILCLSLKGVRDKMTAKRKRKRKSRGLIPPNFTIHETPSDRPHF